MRRRFLAVLFTGIVLAAAAEAPTQADDLGESGSANPGNTSQADEQHCVLDVVDDTTTCFATFTESMAAASGGKIADAPADFAATGDNLDQQINALAEAPGVQNHIVLAIFWAGPNQTGATLTARGDATCDSRSYVYKNLYNVGSPHWANRIRGFRAYANCGITLYEFTYCGGAHRSTPRNASAINLGILEAKATSVRFRYSTPPATRCY